MTAKEIWTEKNRERLRLQQAARDAKKRAEREADPEKMREYKERRRAEYLAKKPNALTKEQYESRGKKVVEKPTAKVCTECGTEKPIEDFPRHGPRGRKAFCSECAEKRKKASRKAVQKAYVSRNREKVNKVKNEWAKKNKPVVVAQKPRTAKIVKPKPEPVHVDRNGYVKILDLWRSRGWILVWGLCDGYGTKVDEIYVMRRDNELAYIRPHGSKVRYSRIR